MLTQIVKLIGERQRHADAPHACVDALELGAVGGKIIAWSHRIEPLLHGDALTITGPQLPSGVANDSDSVKLRPRRIGTPRTAK